MYQNLVEILNRKQITMKAFAEFLGVTEKTVQNKIQEKTEFTWNEVRTTCTIICPEYKPDYVFQSKQNLENTA